MHLTDPTLFRQQALIGGDWRDAAAGARFAVNNPASGERVGEAPRCSAADVETAIEAAHAAFAGWRSQTAKERAQLLRRWFDLMLAQRRRPRRDHDHRAGQAAGRGAAARSSTAPRFIEWFAEEAKRVYGDMIPSPSDDRRIIVIKQPIGVVGAITPWNFPAAMITRKVGAGAGRGLHRGGQAGRRRRRYSALALAELARARRHARRACSTSSPATRRPSASEMHVAARLVRKVTFTGSTEVGKHADAAVRRPRSRSVSLELGGNAPFIVFDDADLDAAVGRRDRLQVPQQPARPASAPTASTCRTASTTRSPRSSPTQGRRG